MTSGSSTDCLGAATKLGYGIGCIAYSLPYQMVASVFLLFATAILRVPALWAGAIIAVTAVWDAISDPLMGAISDNTISRLGRRHPYIIAGGILVALLTWGLWSIDPAASQTVKILALLLPGPRAPGPGMPQRVAPCLRSIACSLREAGARPANWL